MRGINKPIGGEILCRCSGGPEGIRLNNAVLWLRGRMGAGWLFQAQHVQAGSDRVECTAGAELPLALGHWVVLVIQSGTQTSPDWLGEGARGGGGGGGVACSDLTSERFWFP